jgi:hypothetical protein
MLTKDLLTERQKTHGSFGENAEISTHNKIWWHTRKGWDALIPVQKEALDMISLKISRILSGQPNEVDHWDDIAGYAKLAADQIRSLP